MNKKTKILYLTIAITFIACFGLTLQVGADGVDIPVKFSIESGEGLAGETVDLNVSIDKTGITPDPAILDWHVVYDPTAILVANLTEIPALFDGGVSTYCFEEVPGDLTCRSDWSYASITMDNVLDIFAIQFIILNSASTGSTSINLTGTISAYLDLENPYDEFGMPNYIYQTTETTGGTVTILPPPDTTSPTITSFVIPETSPSLTVSVSEFVAIDNVGVTGYIVTESSLTPAIEDIIWEKVATTTYIFSIEGTKTLYAWAKDAAGNISESASSSVIITLPDVTAPSIPTSLTANVISKNQIDLIWASSTDPLTNTAITSGISGYKIFRNSIQIATSTITAFSDTELQASTDYLYTVSAFDGANNESAKSESISATTLAEPAPEPTPTPTPTPAPSSGGGGGGGRRTVTTTTVSPQTTSNPNTGTVLGAFSAPVSISKTLSWGMIGSDVTELQNFLIKFGYLAAGNNSGFFGSLTKTAVQKFQCAQNIVCSGNESSTGYGQVGKLTRDTIAKISGNSTTITTTSQNSDLVALLAMLLKQVAILQAKLAAMQATQ